MFETMPNDRTVNLKLTRGELCRILIILNKLIILNLTGGEAWPLLHDKLKKQLDEFDRKQEVKND